MWFRQDLRVRDNAALAAAAATLQPVIPVFVLDTTAAGEWAAGGASRWWLHRSVASLKQNFARLGSRLILRRGASVDVLLDIAARTGARSIHFSRTYEPHNVRLEHDLSARGRAQGVVVRRFAGTLLAEPESLATKDGNPFRLFTPFWRALSSSYRPRTQPPPLERLTAPKHWPTSDDLNAWQLLPLKPDWAGGLRMSWEPGEAGAERRLGEFMDDALADYATNRDRPDLAGTSRLSPHLHFGELSPHQCWLAIEMARQRMPQSASSATSFLRELGWREFSYHLLHHWPSLPVEPFRPQFAAFPWERDEALSRAHFAAWSRGKTGYPIVDAGMRQLWQTGWMHNRVRMIAASFLTKHLLMPWQTGARWFWDTLVDADLASNSASWQWVAGCGADAAPYFRIFNPILQGQKFDPTGAYVRQFVPEIAGLPDAYLHQPWTAPDDVLARAGVRLGDTYPRPIIAHDAARQRALEAFATIKANDMPASARRKGSADDD
jgi:deoxyribodipyrimidine photo-lyase